MCYFLSVCLSFTIAGSVAFAIISLTAANRDYAKGYFTDASVTSALSEQLYIELDDISQAYSLDKDFLRRVYSADYLPGVQESAMNTIFSGTTANVTDSMNIEYRCRSALSSYTGDEALSGETVNAITEEVKDAFDRVYNIDNSEEFHLWARSLSMSVEFFILCAAASLGIGMIIYFLCARRHFSFNFIASALVSAGGMAVALPFIFMLCSDYADRMFTSVLAYNEAIVSALTTMLYIMIGTGAVMIAAGALIFISNYKYYSVKLAQSDTEIQIEKNLI